MFNSYAIAPVHTKKIPGYPGILKIYTNVLSKKATFTHWANNRFKSTN